MRFLSVAAIVIGVFSVAGFSSEHVSSPQVPLFRRGDANVDGRVNLSDGLFTLRFLFQGGEAPPCSDAADADDSGRLDLKDVIYTFNFLLQGGPPPAQAFQCAVDPTSDDLDCRNYAPEDPSLACDGALDLADNGGGEAVGEVQPGLNARFQSGKGGLPPELAGLTDSGTSLGPEPPPSTAPERVSVLVHLAPGADRVPVRQFATDQGGVVQYEYTIMPNLMNLREIPRTALNALAHVPGVDRVEEDREAHAHLNDSAPLIHALQSQIRDAGLVADGSGVRVCICDTGIDSSHTMYASRIDTAAGRDFANGDNNPEDDFGHGSHVAGIAVGRTGLDISLPGCGTTEPLQGIAPAATLIGVKVLDANGSGSISNIIAGIDHCANQTPSGGRADVINLSLGAGAFAGICDGDSLAAAANAAVAAGVVVVASAGNDGLSDALASPACGSRVIAVGATYDSNFPNCARSQGQFSFARCTDTNPRLDQICCFSNHSRYLDVVAPGCLTLSADFSNPSGSGTVGLCGTSMAAPHVTGLAALLLSLEPALTPEEVRQLIRSGASDLGAAGFDPVFGYGRIDAVNSLSHVMAPSASTDIALTGVSVPPSVTQGAVVNVNVTLRNVGTANVTGNITVSLADTPPAGGTTGTVSAPQTIAGLAAGATTTLTFALNTAGASPGTHTLTARHNFADNNAANNSSSTSVTVTTPTLGGTGNISGRVRDATTGQDLSGAFVITASQFATTDGGGKYLLSNVLPGFQPLAALKLGYFFQFKEANVVAGDTVTVDFLLSRQ